MNLFLTTEEANALTSWIASFLVRYSAPRSVWFNMRLRIATLVIFFVVTAGMPIVKAQETHNATQFIGYAQNEINNFGFNAKQYWFNLSQQVLFQSFSDIQDARILIGIAQSYVGKNETMALMFAPRAAYDAKAANYRLFVYLTASVLRDANQTLYGIPSYIPKPTDAVNNLDRAIQLNRTEVFSMGIPEDPERTWQALDAMERSTDQLWYNQDSVANLARLAKKETLDYLSQQTSIKQQEISGEFQSLRFRSTFQVIIPLVLSLVVAAPTFFMLRRRVRGWFAKIFDFRWSGHLFQRRIMGSLLIGVVVSLAVAAGNLAVLLGELNDKLQLYQLATWGKIPLAENLAYSVIPIGIAVIVLVIFNGAFPRHRLFTGLAALCAFVIGFIALLSAWIMTFMFLSFYS